MFMAFCLHYVTFFLCAQIYRPEPAITTTRCASLICVGPVISNNHHRLGIIIVVTFINLRPARNFNDAWFAWMLCILTIGVYPLSYFQLFHTCCFCQFFFVTHCYISIYLDKQHFDSRNYQCRFHLPFRSTLLSCTCCGCNIHDSEALFSIKPGVTFNCSADVMDAWLYFPGTKVGQV
jgi:hypothetical protein